MPTSPAQHQARIDALMEEASQALVKRRYFDVETLCRQALRRAHAIRDYERIARILLPLQEARRQKRDLAVEAHAVFLVDSEVPTGADLVAGCYLVAPPRVGVDGRALREAADKKEVPVIVIVREPTTREGLWPIVAVGPVTVRTKVPPPPPPTPAPQAPAGAGAKPAKKSTRSKAKAEPAAAPAPSAPAAPDLPGPEWFLAASEALGDAAIASVNEQSHPVSRVDALMDYLEAHPDHEKLHQRLEEAAKAAARDPRPPRRASPLWEEDEEDEDGDGEPEGDGADE